MFINWHIVLAGLIVFKSDVRKNVWNLINTTNYAGVNVWLVTGDSFSTSRFVALNTGIMSKIDEATNPNVIQNGW